MTPENILMFIRPFIEGVPDREPGRNRRRERRERENSSFNPSSIEIKKVISSEYSYKGVTYQIYLPFNGSKVAGMVNMEMTFISEEKEEVITFQPGVYVMVSARMAGVKEIKVKDTFSGGTRVYKEDEIVGYME